MRYLLALEVGLALASSPFALGQSAPSAVARPVLQEFEAAARKARADYLAQVKKAGVDAAAKLDKLKAKAAERKDAQAIVALDAALDELALAAVAADEYDTAKSWEAAPGKVFTVSARVPLNTKFIVPEGKRVFVIPHPDDRWTARAGETPPIDYRGYDRQDAIAAPGRLCALTCKVGQNAPVVMTGPCAVAGSGTLVLFPNDTGLDDNAGSIRVKVVVLSLRGTGLR